VTKPNKSASSRAAEAKLRAKQQAFVEFYLQSWNAADAARKAGYSARSARSIGAENLTKPDIRALIDERLAKMEMGSDEVLARLSDMASSTMADFIKTTKSGSATLDLPKAAKAGKLHLIKKFRVGVEGVSIELYDSLAALVQLGRYHKLFVDRQEHTGKDGGPIDVRDLEAVRQKRWAAAGAALGTVAGDEDDGQGPAGG
jgi:phage terminase small subunit